MRNLIITLLIIFAFQPEARSSEASPLHPTDLRCEYLKDPLGIERCDPRLSWILETEDSALRNQHQITSQILVSHDRKILDAGDGELWNSSRVNSSQSIHVRYAGKPLGPGDDCFWKVRVWDEQGKPSAWSEPGHWRMGLLKPSDWHAKWIGLDEPETKPLKSALDGAQWIWFPEAKPEVSAPIGSRYFRRVIDLDPTRQLTSAILLFTADNAAEMFVNGRRTGAVNNFRMASQVDISKLLHGGKNIIAASADNLDWEDDPNPAGFIASLRLDFAEGDPQLIATGTDWKSSNEEIAGWNELDFNEADWLNAQPLAPAGAKPWGEISVPGERRLAARMLRREFIVNDEVRHATARVCGLGLFEFYLNGQKVGTDALSPALTDYSKRACYITFDITSQLRAGTNAAGIILGNGRFYAPRSRMPTETVSYGFPKLLFQMQIEYQSGATAEIISDEHWKLTTEGPIRANNEYDGEDYDARMEMEGWNQSSFDDSNWRPAQLVTAPTGTLSSQKIEPIRVTQTLKPRAITEPVPGVYVFDFGQNLAGWCRLRVSGQSGTLVSLRHAETLSQDGTANFDNVRSARVTDTYTLKGGGAESYEPRFSYRGFRYVEVIGHPGKPHASSLEARVVHDNLESAGDFECSNGILNDIYKNIRWTLRSNYRSIPTDCPQRDERQGWLGDRGAESKGETYLFNTASFYAKWLQDIRDAQKTTGSVPDICPPYWPIYADDVTFPSTSVLVPGMLHEQYGDLETIASHYSSMQRWITYISDFVTNGVISRDSYKDWEVPPEGPKLVHSKDPTRRTSKALLATAYLFHDLQLMSQYANLLAKPDDARISAELASRIKRAFNRSFFRTAAGQYDNGTQTSCVLPLAFGLAPKQQRQRVFNLLVENITKQSLNHIGTGMIGGQWLLRVLSDNGRPDLAYALACQTTYPSWGYMIEQGATTIPELWNADTAELWNHENSADPGMNSRNHVMLIGDLATWLYEYLAGIRPDPAEPGFKHIIFRCEPVRGLSFVRASHKSPYGLIKSRMEKEQR